HRMRAMAVSNTVAALTMVALAGVMLTGHLSVWVLYAAMFMVIACETVSDPANRITVIQLVPARLLDRANSRAEGGRLVAQDCLGRSVAGFSFCVVLSNIAAGLYYQTVVPDAVRGRISGAGQMIGWGLAPVAALLGGLLGRFDLALPYLVGGVVALLATFLARRVTSDSARPAEEAAAQLSTKDDQ